MGDIKVVYRQGPTQQAEMLTSSDNSVCIFLPLKGGVVAVSASAAHCVNEGQALLLARPETVNYFAPAGAACLVMHVPRQLLQAAAWRLFDEPQRLAASALVFAWTDPPACLSTPHPTPIDPSPNAADAHTLERAICESAVRALDAAGFRASAFSTAKSVARALSRIRSNPSSAWTIEDLAKAAGVTEATLRRNFRACLDLTVTDVVSDTRLHWVRGQLGSVHESRSIAELAVASGFGRPTGLARAYRRCFGETPTQTRSRAFTRK